MLHMEGEEGTALVAARVGGLGVYATPARLAAWRRLRPERAIRAALTFLAGTAVTPLAFLVPPHLEPAVVVFLSGLYFTRRAWVGEWQAARLEGVCPRCDAPVAVRRGAMLYLPHTLSCGVCRSELWLELGEAPAVADAERRAARERLRMEASPDLGGRPPETWSPGLERLA
jgi:hypothetical protein